jgi:lipopolysaccharide/colanic/teichoic acid biosynthesis glycosyltransferase
VPGYQDRHQVLPGITGLAQVQLPPDTDVESVRRKLRYDLHYVHHCSLWLDVRIVLCTVLHMAGASFGLLRRLRLVPAVDETNEASPPVLHRQAA